MNANMPLSSIPPQTNLPATNAVPAGISASPSSTKSDNFSAALTVAGKSSERKSSVAASAATGTDLPAGGNAPPLPEPVAPPVPPASVLLGIPATAAAAAVNAAAVNAAAVNAAAVNTAGVNTAGVNTAGVNAAGEVNGAKSAAAAAASASVQAQTVAAADLLASSADKAAPTALNTAWAATAASSAGAAARDAFAAATTAATAAAPAGEDASASAMAAASAAAAAGKAAIAAQAGSAATTTQDHTASLAATVETAAGGKQAAGAVALQRADGARPGAADAAAASAAATGAANSDPTRDAGSSAVGAASASTAAAAATVLDPSSTSAAQATLAAATENAAARGARDLVPQRSADGKAGVPASAAAGNADAIGGVAANAATAAAVTAPITAFAAIVNGGDKHAQVDALTATAGPALTPTSDGTGATLQLTPDTTVAAATGSTAAGSAKIDAPIGTPEFNETLANHVSWMGGNNITGATLQVSPPQLGPIELRLSIEAGHAQVWMSSHNPATLDALQASSPKLREMLSSQGFQQVSVDVSQRSFQDNSSPYSQAQVWTPQPQSDSEAAGTESRVTATAATRASLGALDAYA
jgi:flagellar hook-length control protein FliK